MKERITCFLPCRAGSERVPKKNIKPFAQTPYGLIEIKLRQLLAATSIDEIVLSTNDCEILDYVKKLDEPKLRIHHRIEELSSSSTSTDQLILHAFDLIPKGHILWTHVTSPFIRGNHYDEMIELYLEQIKKGFDSLMTTTVIQGFLWQDEKPLNYDRDAEKWPRTQMLKPVHEINSGVFIASSEVYSKFKDRIGRNPYLHAIDDYVGFDIDWPADFVIAECLMEKGIVKV